MSDVIHHQAASIEHVRLTAAATQRIVNYLSQKESKGLRLSVKKTGCSGLSYVLDVVNQSQQDDLLVLLDQGFFIAIDKGSYPYLKGVELDYVQQGLNRKFVFNNPNQTGQCGCGESFTVSDEFSG